MAYTKINVNSRVKNNRKYTKKILKTKTLIYTFVWILFFIVLPIFLAFNFINSMFYVSVSSKSMAPTIEKGDKVIVSKIDDNYNIKRDDIIVFYSEELGKVLVKRVVGVPGDVIHLDEDFNVMVNDEYVVENSNLNLDIEYKYDVIELNEEIVVPNEAYFVIGDNIDNSFDSRFWKDKFVSKESIIGKAFVLISPLEKFSVF